LGPYELITFNHSIITDEIGIVMAFEIIIDTLGKNDGSIATITSDTIEEFGAAIDEIQLKWPQWVYFGGVGIGSKSMLKGTFSASLDSDAILVNDEIIFEDNHGFSPIRIKGRWSMKLFLWPRVFQS
tara:strand:+ start:81 stop:461 length:381 start_codon:yes stop_codon:yes gene_type:complete